MSLYNGSIDKPIPPSPIINCLGKLEDTSQVVTPVFKAANSWIVMLGMRQNELGGSIFYALHEKLGAQLPKPDCKQVARQITALHEAMCKKLILAAHDISDGGIAVALAEMSFTNRIGCCINIAGSLSPAIKLWSETGGFVLEVSPENLNDLKKNS